MAVPRTNTRHILAPLALIGALAFTGCSTPAPPANTEAPAAEAAVSYPGTGITKMEDVRWGLIDSPDPAFNEAIEALVLALNAGAAAGISEININAHGPSLVGINVLTDSPDGTLNEDQVRSVLAVLETFVPPEAVLEYEVGGFNENFGRGEIFVAAAAIGVRAEFFEDLTGMIEIPGDQLGNIYG